MVCELKARRSSNATRRGGVILLVAFLLPVMAIMAAFAINTASIELRRTELYIAADSAARAGGRELTVTKSQATAKAKAKLIASRNAVAGKPLTLSDSDLVFGTSTRVGSARYNFTPGGANPNSLSVVANRNAGSIDGAIPLPMPGFLGASSIETSQSAISTQVLLDIVLVIDRSGSMAYAADEIASTSYDPAAAPAGWAFCDAAPPSSRWRDVVAAVQVFNDELTASPTGELLALATYNETATTDELLTSNYADIMAALDVYTQSFCSGGTNIGGGINQGMTTIGASPFSRAGAIKVMIVLTDGIHNTGTDPVTAAANASSGGAMIFSVTFSDQAEQWRMQSVAATGKGKHYHATSGADLQVVFQDIAGQLPTLLTK